MHLIHQVLSNAETSLFLASGALAFDPDSIIIMPILFRKLILAWNFITGAILMFIDYVLKYFDLDCNRDAPGDIRK